jgi:hypothetical protein
MADRAKANSPPRVDPNRPRSVAQRRRAGADRSNAPTTVARQSVRGVAYWRVSVSAGTMSEARTRGEPFWRIRRTGAKSPATQWLTSSEQAFGLWSPIGFLSAIIAAEIARRRGRSEFGFFFAKLFFLGPLGVGFALLATRGEMAACHRPNRSGGGRRTATLHMPPLRR